jgi:hypothetical protein
LTPDRSSTHYSQRVDLVAQDLQSSPSISIRRCITRLKKGRS